MAPQPTIAVVIDETETRTSLGSDLRQRFDAHYDVIELSSAAAPSTLPTVASLAMVITTVELDLGASGVELLAELRHTHPDARRVLLVARGQWVSHPVRRAMVLGDADGYVFVPWAPKEQWLYLPITEYLAAWSRSQPPELYAVTIVGRRSDEKSHNLRDLLTRATIPFRFLEPGTDEGRDALAAMGLDDSTLPALQVLGGPPVTAPSDAKMAELLGFRRSQPGMTCDVAIVGAGPGGLSAAVYAASEGLTTVVVDPSIPGGQAGTSSRIRNYLGFPRGLSGDELTTRAVEQAWLFGAEFLLGQRVVELRRSDGSYELRLADGTDIRASALVIATGVAWRRLGVPSVEGLLGSGVFYGAAGSEADALRDEHVFVVGGGNSAGQAAVHLARRATTVTLVIRGSSLSASMSDYLIGELDAIANVAIRPTTDVVAASGDGRLERLTLRDRRTGAEEVADAAGLFVMIGGEPRTEWLPAEVLRDEYGYLLTGDDIPSESHNPGRAPLFLETSLPGVFAVGDVRHGATRRVAPSVGAGAIAISLVHQYLAERPEPPVS
jgi:thioredoxin reductase (NADPH)